MGLPTIVENEKKEKDDILFGSFEDLNEISVQEQQQSCKCFVLMIEK